MRRLGAGKDGFRRDARVFVDDDRVCGVVWDLVRCSQYMVRPEEL